MRVTGVEEAAIAFWEFGHINIVGFVFSVLSQKKEQSHLSMNPLELNYL
jgi:hypothetical protein